MARAWIAAHFDAPIDYVRRGLRSNPDYPAAHGLRSPEGYRLAWTIEAQVEVGVAGALHHVLLARRDLYEDMHNDPEIADEFLGITSAPPDSEEYVEADFNGYVAGWLEKDLHA